MRQNKLRSACCKNTFFSDLFHRMASISKPAYLSSTPRPAVGKSSNGWQRTSATGVSAPSRFSPCCPHLLRRIAAAAASRSALWPDRSIIVPIACYRRTGSCPALTAYFDRSPSKESSQRSYKTIRWGLAAFFRRVIAQPLCWLAALYRGNGKVFDEMGILFSKSGACRQNGNRRRAFYRPPPVS